MKMVLKFEGGKEVADKLAELSKRMGKRVTRDALEVGAEPIRRDMARRAPRRAPHPDMADHMVVSPLRTKQGETAVIAIGPAKEFTHGLFQEIGTVHHGAQPFARPAFDAQRGNALEVIRKAFWTALAAVGVSRSVSAPTMPSGPGGLV